MQTLCYMLFLARFCTESFYHSCYTLLGKVKTRHWSRQIDRNRSTSFGIISRLNLKLYSSRQFLNLILYFSIYSYNNLYKCVYFSLSYYFCISNSKFSHFFSFSLNCTFYCISCASIICLKVLPAYDKGKTAKHKLYYEMLLS